MVRLGIDLGRAATSAVLVDERGEVVATSVADGPEDAIRGLGPLADIELVAVSTRAAEDALLRPERLRPVAVLRLGAPATLAVRPLATWPDHLREHVFVDACIAEGGFEIDGREIAPLDHETIAAFASSLAGRADAIAIVSVFATVSNRHERLAAETVATANPAIRHVSTSQDVGTVGLLERENAAVLNAALSRAMGELAGEVGEILERCGVEAPLFFSRNNGTLMHSSYALTRPLHMIGSQVANSMRGAGHLARLEHGIVLDIGELETTGGWIDDGLPRDADGDGVSGIPTNFRMPVVERVAVGGRTAIRRIAGSYSLEASARSAASPTIEKAALVLGRGDASPQAKAGRALRDGLALADDALVDLCERVRASEGDADVVVVGGWSFIAPMERLPGRAVRPQHGELAAAVGAAVAPVGGAAERLVPAGRGAAAAAEVARAAADDAVLAGADPGAVVVAERERVLLSYLPRPAVRIRATAVGSPSALAG